LNIVLLGAPGAGKGTQAELLAEHLNVPHVATGDLFREALRGDTPLGRKAKEYMDRGELVPDEVTVAMVRQRLAAPDTREGVILDGFPRTVEQAQALDELLAERGRQVDVAIFIHVGPEALLERLSGRWICRDCQGVYHSFYKPPRVPEVCDTCGTGLYQRLDDRPETQRRRVDVYLAQTAPLIAYYQERGVLAEVDGEQEIDRVQEQLRSVVTQVRTAG
jgi:adenylate kinase